MARSRAMADLFGGRKRRGLMIAIGVGREGPPPPPVAEDRGPGPIMRPAGMRGMMSARGGMRPEDPSDMVRRGLEELAAQGKPWAKDMLEEFERRMDLAQERAAEGGTEENEEVPV